MSIGEIEINEKIFKKIMIFFIVLIFLFAGILLIQYSVLRPYHFGNGTRTDEGGEIVKGVVVGQGNRMIEITGYAYKTGQKIERFNSDFVLKNIESGKMYKLQTTMEKNHNLMEVDGLYDCSNSGMKAKAFTMGLKSGIYEICIVYNNDGEDIFSQTGVMVEIK